MWSSNSSYANQQAVTPIQPQHLQRGSNCCPILWILGQQPIRNVAPTIFLARRAGFTTELPSLHHRVVMCMHRMYEDDFEPDSDSSPAVTGDGPNRTSNSDLGSTQQKAKKSAAAGTTPTSRLSSAPAADSMPQRTNKDDIYDFSDVQY